MTQFCMGKSSSTMEHMFASGLDPVICWLDVRHKFKGEFQEKLSYQLSDLAKPSCRWCWKKSSGEWRERETERLGYSYSPYIPYSMGNQGVA